MCLKVIIFLLENSEVKTIVLRNCLIICTAYICKMCIRDRFAGKDATSMEYVKGGGAAGNQIDAISGATVTTNAVTEAVNLSLIHI